MKRIIMLGVFVLSVLSAYSQQFVKGNLIYHVIEGTNEVSVGTVRIISPVEFDIPSKVSQYEGSKEYDVTSIRENGFYGCTGLTSITIPNSITTIGDNAFKECYNLTTITIPSSVTSIGNSAFSNCTGLISIYVESENNNYASKDGVLFNKEKTDLILCPSGEIEDYVIPNGVISISNNAFSNCSNLKSITISNSVTTIGKSAFSGCNKLIELTSPIGTIQNLGLTKSTIKEIKKVTIIEPCSIIEVNAFNGCSSLIEINLPETVTSILASAFSGCESLTSITLPDKLSIIGNWSFSHCTGITSMSIPESVTNMEYCAFWNNNNLSSIDVYWKEPLQIDYESNIFYLVNVSNCILNIPKGTMSAYQISDVWKDFILKEQEETSINNIMIENLQIYSNNSKLYIQSEIATKINIYSITGLSYPINLNVGLNEFSLPKGVYIVEGEKIIVS